MEQIILFNTRVDNLSMQETIDKVDEAVYKNKQIIYADINADKIVTLQTDPLIQDYFNEATIVNVDGQAVVWASKLLGNPIKERVAGVDLMQELVKLSAEKNYKVYLLGAKEEVVSKLVQMYKSQYGANIISGYRNGYFDQDDEAEIINDIVKSEANFLFVAITSPKKEEFLHRYKKQLSSINFIMGVGGSFDVHAGFIKRAPTWMQKSGLEWAFRIYQEPKRMWKRYLVSNTRFLMLLAKNMCFGK